MNKKVVYTSLVGSYDYLQNPKYIMNGWDYVCFSNNIEEKKDLVWEIRKIPFKINDDLRLSRFSKLNPHLVLSEYDISLYIDANLIVLDNSVEKILNDFIKSRALISIPKHPYRNCIYNEAKICLSEGKDFGNLILDQIKFLKLQKFPKNFGLFENNLIFRRHNHEKMKEFARNWWDIYMKFSKRDQLSLAYLLWTLEIECTMFFKDGSSSRSFNGIDHVEHNEPFMARFKRSMYIRINKLFSN